MLVLGTYRDIEFDVGKPFEKALAAFVRQPRYFVCRCTAAANGGRRAPWRRLEEANHPLPWWRPPLQETEGNPFFVGEMFEHLSEEGQLFDEAASGRSVWRSIRSTWPEGTGL